MSLLAAIINMCKYTPYFIKAKEKNHKFKLNC